MKILAFSGSPQMEKGSTDKILQAFLKGAEDAGAETETIYIPRQNIKFCGGCLDCWIAHPGKCIHDDDIPMIMDKIKYSDVMVYASPVYFDGLTAQMKKMMDRFVIGAKPNIDVVDGHSRHPSRGKGSRKRKVLLLSTCGFGELDNFDVVVHHMTAAAKNMRAEYIGAILRPMGPLFKFLTPETEMVKDVFAAIQKAGKEVVKTGYISEDTLKEASKPVMRIEDYANMINGNVPKQ